MNEKTLNVSQLNSYIHKYINFNDNFQNLLIVGEIGTITYSKSGLIYFTLKDTKSSIRGVAYPSSGGRENLVHGKEVLIRGEIVYYSVVGQIQLLVWSVVLYGAGSIEQHLQELKNELAALGYFDEKIKKELPKYPNKIGLITSPTSAALGDVRRILEKRYPLAELLFFPIEVQGKNAVMQLVKTIQNELPKHLIDICLLVRGGGSKEDLWVFNEKRVAEVIFHTKIPIVSAIGHERDESIADLVADVKALTPTDAAYLATPDITEIGMQLFQIESELHFKLSTTIDHLQNLLLNSNYRINAHLISLENVLEQLKLTSKKLELAMTTKITTLTNKIDLLILKINTLNPKNQLKRGFCLVYDKFNSIVTDTQKIRKGDQLDIKFSTGYVITQVKEITK